MEYNGEFYPPKYIISIANKYVNGKELDPEEFSGGVEANQFLKSLVFNIVKLSSKRWEIEVREEPNPSIARVIIKKFKWNGEPIEARQLLEDIYENQPKGRKVKFLITCGGFIQFDWLKSISRKDIGDNKNPNSETLSELVAEAEKCVNFVLTDGLCRKLSKVADYITLGIDSFKDKTKQFKSELHIELVFLKDLR